MWQAVDRRCELDRSFLERHQNPFYRPEVESLYTVEYRTTD